jgi:hypothetical protein
MALPRSWLNSFFPRTFRASTTSGANTPFPAFLFPIRIGGQLAPALLPTGTHTCVLKPSPLIDDDAQSTLTSCADADVEANLQAAIANSCSGKQTFLCSALLCSALLCSSSQGLRVLEGSRVGLKPIHVGDWGACRGDSSSVRSEVIGPPPPHKCAWWKAYTPQAGQPSANGGPRMRKAPKGGRLVKFRDDCRSIMRVSTWYHQGIYKEELVPAATEALKVQGV